MKECSFVILSSCAEGCATAVITAMGNGGLIPLVSKQCGVDIVNGVLFDSNDEATIESAIRNSMHFYTKNMIIEHSKINIEYVKKYFSIEVYNENLKNIFRTIFADIK